MLVGLAGNSREWRGSGNSPYGDVDELKALGIDDLAKYRIVESLCARPDTCWDVHQCSESLGLRPVERTRGVMEELAGRGILDRQYGGDLGRYRLTRDIAMRRALARLFAVPHGQQIQGRVLAWLSLRSIERIRTAGKRKSRPQRAP